MASRAEWVQRLEKWKRSGLSMREFAEKERLRFRSLEWWSWRLRADAAVASSTALMPTAAKATFVELKAEPVAAPQFEIVLSNGRVVRVPSAFDDASLSRLLTIVDEVA